MEFLESTMDLKIGKEVVNGHPNFPFFHSKIFDVTLVNMAMMH